MTNSRFDEFISNSRYIIAIGYVMCVGLFHYLQYCAVIELKQIYAF